MLGNHRISARSDCCAVLCGVSEHISSEEGLRLSEAKNNSNPSNAFAMLLTESLAHVYTVHRIDGTYPTQ